MSEKTEKSMAVQKASEKMFEAVRSGRSDLLKAALEAGAEVEMRDGEGDAALTMAAFLGHVECVRVLLAAGADVDVCDDGGNTGLILAARFGHAQTVACLLKAGADVEARKANRATALSQAAWSGWADCVKALLMGGADPSAKRWDGRMAVDLCKVGSECWTMLESAREARELDKAVGKARQKARKAGL